MLKIGQKSKKSKNVSNNKIKGIMSLLKLHLSFCITLVCLLELAELLPLEVLSVNVRLFPAANSLPRKFQCNRLRVPYQ